MCYSAMMEADYATYVRRFGAEISFSEFVQLYWQRETALGAMRTPRGMDRAFAAAKSAEGRTIKEAVDRHAQTQVLSLSHELQAQRDRLFEAEAKLARKVTKAASESRRIASQKIARIKEQIDDLLAKNPQGTVQAFWEEALRNRFQQGTAKFFTRPQLMVFDVKAI